MDRHSTTTRSDLEVMLCDEKEEPKALPLSLLEEITNGFSNEQEIGRGGFAVVYKGMLKNGVAVAVKRLSNTYMFEKEFHREVECLIKANHKNVRTRSYDGKFVMADVQQRLLCFEYLSQGTLDKYITDPSSGLDWRKRYKIINGICEGLDYLHKNRIIHLDLKPPNILLDDNMLPKIADFGLSRCFNENQSRAITSKIGGTMGYLAPEFFSNREITYRLDLYSLGVIIIEMLTGKKGYLKVGATDWRNHRDIQLAQVRVCAEIGIQCIESNPAKRPVSMQHIIARLHETGSKDGSIEAMVARSSALQVETDSDDLHQGALKASFEISSVSELTDVSVTSSDQLRRISPPKGLGETSTEDFSFSGSSMFALDRTIAVQMSEVVLLAVTKIGSILGDEAAKAIIAKIPQRVTKELPVKFEQIRKQLTMMGNVVRQIGALYLTDEVVKSWIGEVHNVAYHVEDVMDKYSYHVLQLQGEGFLKKFFIKTTHYYKVFSEIADEVIDVEKEIELVIKMKDQWLLPSQLVPPVTETESQHYQETFPEFVRDEDLVGIENNRILLTRWLYEGPGADVITVSGMGGLGKSTLVSNVYEREKINFPAHAWIVVSQVCTVNALLRKLLWKIGSTEQPLSAGIDKLDVFDLKKEIHQRLRNRKFFIVLDDVWEPQVYFQVLDAFQNLQGSRIVITTRKDNVAGISSPTRHLELQPLSQSDAFDLFCRRAFYNRKGHRCPKDLEMIATSIVDRCHGLPLAIVIIGGMLSSRQRLDIWTQTYNQLRSELSNNDHVRAILNLSYHDLPGDLRNCLLYCSLFPEDYPMSRDNLMRLWVAEGFVLSNEKNTPEVVAERNLMELIHRNMLEVVENDELGRVNTFKMHDIVRELAISVANEQRFASANDYGTMLLIDKDVRRLSSCGWKYDTGLQLKLPRLRTLMSRGVFSSGLLSSILSESIYLTVLDLQDSEITVVPTSIGRLFNLRYIGLRGTKVKSLPDSIENLSKLHTIDIKQTKIEKLPPGLVKIRKLRHLLADRYADEKQTEFRYFMGITAPTNLSNLEELQTLETLESSNDLAEQLKKLMQLRSVWIDSISAADCANLFATLSNMPFLSSLLLSARDENEPLCFEALSPKSRNLQRYYQRAMGQGHTELPNISQPQDTHQVSSSKLVSPWGRSTGVAGIAHAVPHISET